MPITSIYDHDSELDMLHKNNLMELENWLHHMGSITDDIESMLNLTGHKCSKKSLLYQKLIDRKRENSAQLDVYLRYANQIKGSMECEDLLCDHYYVKRHEEFRRIYRYNLERFDKVKEEFFSMMSSKGIGQFRSN